MEPGDGLHRGQPGCAHCYAKTFAERFRGVPGHPYERGFDLQLRPERLDQPLRWKKPRSIFVNSMSDLFHEDVPEEYIREVFAVMALADHHRFQVLTKRAERLAELAPSLPWPAHVWMGVSVENQRWTSRIDYLREVPAAVRFLSCEPLLGPLELDLERIDWVIAAAKAVRGRGRCSRSGRAAFAISRMRGGGRRSSSSSSGARMTRAASESARSGRGASSMTSCATWDATPVKAA